MLTQAQIAPIKQLFCRLCREVNELSTTSALQKQDLSPVTVADFYAQAVISHTLKKSFPQWGLLAEENFEDLEKSPEIRAHVAKLLGGLDMHALQNRSWTPKTPYWVLDPIDGTKGFIDQRQYAIALALIDKGEVVFGILGCPRLNMQDPKQPAKSGSLVYALKGKGAFMQSLQTDEITPLKVSQEQNIHQVVLCESVESGHTSHAASTNLREKLQISVDPLRVDSQCKYALVAGGQATVYLRTPTSKEYQEKVWDHAAGSLIITESGGTVTDLDGKALDFSAGKTLSKNRGIFASNGQFDAKPFA